MSRGKPITIPIEVILESYSRLKNIWKVGAELGISGQAAHVRLKEKLGYLEKPQFTEDQKLKIIQYYTSTTSDIFDLNELSEKIGKSRSDICGFAGEQGLTNRSRPDNAKTTEALRIRFANRWSQKPHPRGMMGKKHTPETLAIVSESSKRSWATMKLTKTGNASPEAMKANSARLQQARLLMDPAKNYSRANSGKRSDLGDIHFRSSWEANYARYLNLLVKMKVVEWWDFEKETFWFENIKRGVRSYKPDFRVKYKHDPVLEYVEIKGWVTSKDRTKWKRMKKYHPNIKLVVVGKKEYESIRNKWRSAIPTWEAPQRLSKLRAA